MALLPGLANAQVLTAAAPRPDAGSLQQQIDRERKQALPPEILPEVQPQPSEMKPPSGLSITVKSFRFAGNRLLDEDVLTQAVAGYLNRPLDFAELQKAAAAVAQAYRDAGWVVRTYLPEQDIVDGIVTIQIVEAIFGEVQFEGAEEARVGNAKIKEMILAQQQSGQPLNADAIDRALLLAGDRPDAAVSGNLREGKQPRTTDLLVKSGDKAMVFGTAATDNNGARSTGSERLTAALNIGSSMGLGELVSANLIHTRGPDRLFGDGSDYGRLAVSLPVGLDGLTVGVSGSYLEYQLVSPQFVALAGKGTSTDFGADSSYPLIRSRMRNLYLNANYDHKHFDNYSLGTVSSRYDDDVASLGASGNLFDSWGGGGANAVSLTLTGGYLNLDGSPTFASDAATVRTAGAFGKLRFSLSRQQTITDDLSLFGSVSGQRASKNLDSSEKFYLGGADGVRAFPVNEGGGSDADLLNIELRQKLADGLNLAGFFDYGWIAQNHNNNISGAASQNAYSLKGAGLSLAWQSDFGPIFRAVWAHRIGGNPNPSSTGNDQDGSLILDRLWLSASMPF